MRRTIVVTCVSVLLWLSGSLVAEVLAQRAPERNPSPAAFRAPRTAWGDPDLQGIWPSGALMSVPFERPEALGTRADVSDEEAATRDKSLAATFDSAAVAPPPHWLELGGAPSLGGLASLVVDPSNGRLPPMTDDGARRAGVWRTKSAPTYPVASPEDMRLYDRCITRGVLGSSFPNIYSTGTQILQAPGLVVILYEMIHETRVIPVDGRAHVDPSIRSYMGDARGRWEGDTLVVETTNFEMGTGSYGRNGDGNPTSRSLRLVERFRLSGPKTLQYEVRVEDPETWTRPWTVAYPLERDDEYVIYEYACHEGNYAMANVLRAARVAEQGQATQR